ncbi:hypothetical protein HGA91_00415 [candidate division WWE3 bacterium]|nr:hypothetical protein [candidate division WWE3 bacterium]
MPRSLDQKLSAILPLMFGSLCLFFITISLYAPFFHKRTPISSLNTQDVSYAAGGLAADINDDYTVDIFDLGILSANYGKTITVGSSDIERKADINANGTVDVFDLGILTGSYGQHVQQNLSNRDLFLNEVQINEIKSKLSTEPMKTAYEELLQRANTALSSSTTYSVTFNGGPPAAADPHILWSGGDLKSARSLEDTLTALTLVYRLTGDTKYADKAVSLLRVWALNEDTYMKPILNKEQEQGGNNLLFMEYGVVPPVYNASLLENYPGWQPYKQAFYSWARSMAQVMVDANVGNTGVGIRRLMTIAAVGALLDDSTLQNYAYTHVREMLDTELDSDGSIKSVRSRNPPPATDGVGVYYSALWLNVGMQLAEISRHHGVDLYNYTTPNGANMRKALTFLWPYIKNSGSGWPYQLEGQTPQQITEIPDTVSPYEIAAGFWKGSSWESGISLRPLYLTGGLGPVTLTHSSGVFIPIDTRPTPTLRPTTTPIPVSGISIVSKASNNTYTLVGGGTQIGQQVFSDRIVTFANIPSEYVGLTLLQTPVNDRTISNETAITLRVDHSVTVYVAFDSRVTGSIPSWLTSSNGWTNTGKTITIDEEGKTHTLFSKTFSAGQINLGGVGLSTDYFNYYVLIK